MCAENGCGKNINQGLKDEMSGEKRCAGRKDRNEVVNALDFLLSEAVLAYFGRIIVFLVLIIVFVW